MQMRTESKKERETHISLENLYKCEMKQGYYEGILVKNEDLELLGRDCKDEY